MTNIRPTLLIAVLFFLGAAVVMRAEDRALEKTVTAGIFVTPVAGAPFSAEVERDTMQALKDGSRLQRRTVNTIARDSQGRIRNERHEVLASTSTRKPILYSVHLLRSGHPGEHYPESPVPHRHAENFGAPAVHRTAFRSAGCGKTARASPIPT